MVGVTSRLAILDMLADMDGTSSPESVRAMARASMGDRPESRIRCVMAMRTSSSLAVLNPS